MKKSMIMIMLLAVASLTNVFGQGTVQEICIGSGVHCASLTYGTIKMTFVKSRTAPGIRIKEVK